MHSVAASDAMKLDVVASQGWVFGTAECRGRTRAAMEDFVSLHPTHRTFQNFAVAGVYDGHGRDTVSKRLAAAAPMVFGPLFQKGLASAPTLTAACLHLDASLSRHRDCGSTMCLAAVRVRGGGPDAAVVSVGDSPSCVVRSSGDVEHRTALYHISTSSRPMDAATLRRVQLAGGSIEEGRIFSVPPSCGLNMSRTLGDFDDKSAPGIAPEAQVQIAVPAVEFIGRLQDGDVLVLASDGVCRGMSPQMPALITRAAHAFASCHTLEESFTCLASAMRGTQRYTADNVCFTFVRRLTALDTTVRGAKTRTLTAQPATAESDAAAPAMKPGRPQWPRLNLGVDFLRFRRVALANAKRISRAAALLWRSPPEVPRDKNLAALSGMHDFCGCSLLYYAVLPGVVDGKWAAFEALLRVGTADGVDVITPTSTSQTTFGSSVDMLLAHHAPPPRIVTAAKNLFAALPFNRRAGRLPGWLH